MKENSLYEVSHLSLSLDKSMGFFPFYSILFFFFFESVTQMGKLGLSMICQGWSVWFVCDFYLFFFLFLCWLWIMDIVTDLQVYCIDLVSFYGEISAFFIFIFFYFQFMHVILQEENSLLFSLLVNWILMLCLRGRKTAVGTFELVVFFRVVQNEDLFTKRLSQFLGLIYNCLELQTWQVRFGVFGFGRRGREGPFHYGNGVMGRCMHE